MLVETKQKEIFEQLKIKNIIDERMANYNPKKNVSWESIKEKKNIKKKIV